MEAREGQQDPIFTHLVIKIGFWNLDRTEMEQESDGCGLLETICLSMT